MQLEPRIGIPEGIRTVEAVCEVDADRSQRRNDAHADTRAAEQPGRVELTSSRPHVAGIDERRHVEHLRESHPELTGHRQVRLPERRGGRLIGRRGSIAVRGDGKLVIAAQRNAVLYAAHREELVEEGGVSEHEPRSRRKAHDQLDRCRVGRAAQLADGGIPPAFEVEPLKITGAPERATRLRNADRMHGARGRER